MDIRREMPTDREVLLGVWLRSIRVTHTFLSEEDIQSMIPQVRTYSLLRMRLAAPNRPPRRTGPGGIDQ